MEVQDNPATPSRGLSDPLTDEVVEYRPVSAAAVLGLVLAVASPLALVTEWLGFLPIVAAVLCLVATLKVRKSPETLSGQGIAIVGLVVACVAVGASNSQRLVEHRLHAATATAVADRFVGALEEGDAVAAYELTLPFAERMADPKAAASHYADDEEAAERLEHFHEIAPVHEALGQSLEPLGMAGAGKGSVGRVAAMCRYLLPAHGDEAESVLIVTLERPDQTRLGKPAWRVADFRLEPAAD